MTYSIFIITISLILGVIGSFASINVTLIVMYDKNISKNTLIIEKGKRIQYS